MEMDAQAPPDQGLGKYRSFIAGQLKSGTDPSDITKRLVQMGVSEPEAQQMVITVQGEVVVTRGAEPLVSTAIPMAIVGGVIAALVGGAIWGFIVKLTNYEIGYMAWGVGLLCGGAVLLFTGGKKGLPLQVIAVLCSVLGIVIGKYAMVYFIAKQMLPSLGFFSPEMFKLFQMAFKELFSGFDILWVIFAVITAWGMLNPSKGE